MSNPVNSIKNKDPIDQVLESAESTIKTGWNATHSVAEPIQRFGRWTYSFLPQSVQKMAQNTWEECDNQTALKVATAGVAAAAAGTIGFMGSLVVGTAVGTATATNCWVNGDSKKVAALKGGIAGATAAITGSAYAVGAVVGLGVTGKKMVDGDSLGSAALKGALAGAGSGAAIAFTGAAIPALGMATTVGAATLMAEYPNHRVVVQVPDRPTFTLKTPSTAPALPQKPAQALSQLENKISSFTETQPATEVWKNPPVPPVAPSLSPEYVEAREETNRQLTKMIEISSMYSTVYFMHTNRFNNVQTPALGEIYRKIAEKASTEVNGEKPSLWSVYMEFLGEDLTFFQKWVRAPILYFFTYMVGAIPNSIQTFMTNFMSGIRSDIENGRTEHLNSVMKGALKGISNFIDQYNGASENFVQEHARRGDLSVYQDNTVAEMGNAEILHKIRDFVERNPGANLGNKMMEELCKQFTANLVDDFFPRIPFFDSLKRWTFLGIRLGAIFDVLDWALGGVLNWIGNKLCKYYLPGVVQSLVQTGLDQTGPEEYGFKTSLINLLTKQIEELDADLAIMDTSKPLRMVDDSVINGAADRVLKLLDLFSLGQNPEYEVVEAKLNELKQGPQDPKVRDRLRKLVIMGTQKLIHHYGRKPEALEKLFGDLLQTTNEALQPGGRAMKETDFDLAVGRLEKTANKLIVAQVREGVQEEILGPNDIKMHRYLNGVKDSNGNIIHQGLFDKQKNNAVETFTELNTLIQAMKAKIMAPNEEHLLVELDHYVDILKKFAAHAKSIEIDLYPVTVQDAFYDAFHQIYQTAIPLAEQAINLQIPQIVYDKHKKAAIRFAEIEQLLINGNREPMLFKQKLNQLKAIEVAHRARPPQDPANPDAPVNPEEGALLGVIPGWNEKTAQLSVHIANLEEAMSDIEEERLVIEKLQQLENPDSFSARFLADPKKWLEIIYETIPAPDQEPLFSHIRRFRANYRLDPRPDLTPDSNAIAAEIQAILRKHINQKAALELRLTDSVLTPFQTWATDAKNEHGQKRDLTRREISQKISVLAGTTEQYSKKLEEVKLPALDYANHLVPQEGLDKANVSFGEPLVEKFMQILTPVQQIITNKSVYEGACRLFMGEMITWAEERRRNAALREQIEDIVPAR